MAGAVGAAHLAAAEVEQLEEGLVGWEVTAGADAQRTHTGAERRKLEADNITNFANGMLVP